MLILWFPVEYRQHIYLMSSQWFRFLLCAMQELAIVASCCVYVDTPSVFLGGGGMKM